MNKNQNKPNSWNVFHPWRIEVSRMIPTCKKLSLRWILTSRHTDENHRKQFSKIRTLIELLCWRFILSWILLELKFRLSAKTSRLHDYQSFHVPNGNRLKEITKTNRIIQFDSEYLQYFQKEMEYNRAISQTRQNLQLLS